MTNYRNKKHDRGLRQIQSQELMLSRAQEAIEFLTEKNGYFEGSKGEFAQAMYDRTKRSHWLRNDGFPNRQLVADVCNFMRDQHQWPEVEAILAGYMVVYAPSRGGMTLVGSQGEMKQEHLLHMLGGDMTRQQATKTINRRRVAGWKVGANQACQAGQIELGLLMGQIQNQIDATGFATDSLVAEFYKELGKLGIEVEADA